MNFKNIIIESRASIRVLRLYIDLKLK